ncbi:MAG: signal peptidase I [Mycobacteriales bacterium]|nr:signal peptidase I [Mycobacteriales bacterium]
MTTLDDLRAPLDLSSYLPSPRTESVGTPLADDPARSWTDEPRARQLPERPVVAAPPARERAGGRWVDHLLTLGAVVGLLVTGLTVAATLTGLRPLVVRSGSMEPTISTGGMVLTRQVTAAEIGVGDVVAVERPDRTRVTHRVVAVVQRGATAELTLKGDANTDNDPLPVTVTTAGEVVYSAPWLGRVSAFLASAKGGFVLGLLVGAVVVTTLRRQPER